MVLYRQELKLNLKSFLIWFFVIVGMCFGCVLLYSSVEASLSEMGDVFSKMGAMSVAFGMDRLSVATMEGYFATEIAMLHALGGAMFAAILGSNLLSKEEFGKTIEFLAVLPWKRSQIVLNKYGCLVTYLFLFQILGTLSYLGGFAIMGEELSMEHLIEMTALQFLMMWEVGTICFCVSAFSGKNRMSVGLGVTLLFFAMDVMCRVIPAIENLKYVTPFYYCNCSDVFTDTETPVAALILGGVILVVAMILALWRYEKKDLG